MKKLALVSLVACGGGSQSAPPPPEPHMPMPPAGPPAADRKHAVSTLPAELTWDGTKATLAGGMRFQKVQHGAAFDVTDGAVVVVEGTVENEKGQQIVYWHQHPHRLMCTNAADCLLFVHANASAASADTRPEDLAWAPLDATRPGLQAAQLWGDRTTGPGGLLLRLPAGGPADWHIHKHDVRGVVLVGTVVSYESGTTPRDLPVGSTWWQPGGYKHATYCTGTVDCVVMLDVGGPFDIVPAQ